jgi:hypothetical protein
LNGLDDAGGGAGGDLDGGVAHRGALIIGLMCQVE